MDTTPVGSALVDATVRVTGVDLDAPATGAILAANFPDLIWEEHGDLVTLTLSVAKEDVIAQVVDVCRRLEAQVLGLKVKGVYRDLVNATDIASRVGVSREAVRKWTSHQDFPSPEDVVGGDSVKIWVWTEVATWLFTARGINLDETLPTVEQMTQIENCLMRNPDHTTIQWLDAQAGRPARPAPVFQAVQRGTGRRVVIDAASGRGQSSADKRRPTLGAAGCDRN